MGLSLPTVENFLLIYSLRTGCLVVFFWSLIRSFFTVFFYTIVILETFVGKDSPFGRLFIHSDNTTTEDNVLEVYYCSLTMILADAFMLIYCLYLGLGVFSRNCAGLPQFLICRFITWMIEVTCLFVLCLVHKLLIGWYLALFFSVVLEFYGFVVVYSYFVELCVTGCLTCKPACTEGGAQQCQPIRVSPY